MRDHAAFWFIEIGVECDLSVFLVEQVCNLTASKKQVCNLIQNVAITLPRSQFCVHTISGSICTSVLSMYDFYILD